MYSMTKFWIGNYLTRNSQLAKTSLRIKEGQWQPISYLPQNTKPIQKYGVILQKKKAKDPYQIWPINQMTESQTNPTKQEPKEKTPLAKGLDWATTKTYSPNQRRLNILT